MIQQQVLQRLKLFRTVTRNYYALKGLQGVPFGVTCLVVAVLQSGWFHLRDGWMDVALYSVIFAFLVSLVLYCLIGDYYDRNFGCVERVKPNKLDMTIGILGLSVLLFGAMRMDISMILPISASGCALALWLFITWWCTGSFRAHILFLALLIGLISLLPLLGFTSLHTFFLPTSGGYMLVFGLLLSIGGICDHLILMNAFGRRQRGYYDQTI